MIDFIIENAKTPLLPIEAGEREEIRTSKKLLNHIPRLVLAILGVAAVLLFTPLSQSDFAGFGLFSQDNLLAGQVLSSFKDVENQGDSLIIEKSLEAQAEQIERRIVEAGSFVYPSGYGFSGQGDVDDGFGGEELSGNILVQGNAFLGSSNPSSDLTDGIGVFGKEREQVVNYEVQTGDTLSYVAASFGLSTNTLLWANNLDSWSIIKPGQKLVILPTSGVLYEIKKGETLAAVVKKYKGDFDEVIAYNGLPADGLVKAGQKVIIPGGAMPVVYSQPRTRVAQSPSFIGPYSGISHQFPWGQCTWYVAQKRYIPFSGNAKQWLANAQKYGFQTGKEPRVGAIVATNETWYGHVAYVEMIQGDTITISEMSLGRGKIGYRTLNKNDRRIRGYIY